MGLRQFPRVVALILSTMTSLLFERSSVKDLRQVEPGCRERLEAGHEVAFRY